MPDRFELEAEMDAPLVRLRKPRRDPIPRGHAAPLGTGPAGETCGSCGNLKLRRLSKVYYKCGLMKHAWTGGRASDVRTKDAACKHWTKALWSKKADRPLC